MLTLKSSDGRPAYKNQVKFDHPHKNWSIDSTLETSHVRPAHKIQANIDPHAENQANLDP